MKELKCNNCNSADLEYTGGNWVCQSCGSKYIPSKDEVLVEPEGAKLLERPCDMRVEIESTGESEEPQMDQRKHLFKIPEKPAEHIIKKYSQSLCHDLL